MVHRPFFWSPATTRASCFGLHRPRTPRLALVSEVDRVKPRQCGADMALGPACQHARLSPLSVIFSLTSDLDPALLQQGPCTPSYQHVVPACVSSFGELLKLIWRPCAVSNAQAAVAPLINGPGRVPLR
jgi:hypothetical protein